MPVREFDCFRLGTPIISPVKNLQLSDFVDPSAYDEAPALVKAEALANVTLSDRPSAFLGYLPSSDRRSSSFTYSAGVLPSLFLMVGSAPAASNNLIISFAASPLPAVPGAPV